MTPCLQSFCCNKNITDPVILNEMINTSHNYPEWVGCTLDKIRLARNYVAHYNYREIINQYCFL